MSTHIQNSRELRPISKIIERLHGERPRRLRLQATPMRGGLEAAAVLHVRASFHDRNGRRRSSDIVVKRLEGAVAREAAVYQKLVTKHARNMAPQLLGIYREGRQRSVLYLEWVRPISNWPWRDLTAAEHLIRRLARLHSRTAAHNTAASLPSWDYENELKESSETTLQLLSRCRRHSQFGTLARYLPAVRRLALALPNIRRELLGFLPLGSVAIHGDVHPGNVLVRQRAGKQEPILIDWGRARTGSPLEDLNAWLQSLGYWEPQARRRHDTLLAGYLSARGMEPRLSRDLRAAYWLAGASNALSGALAYHLSLLFDETEACRARKQSAVHSARDWLRIIRRAVAVWHAN